MRRPTTITRRLRCSASTSRRSRRSASPLRSTRRPPAPPFAKPSAGLAGYELFAEPEIAKALVEYYSANPDFIWITANEVNERGSDAVRVLGEAASHGLSSADYAINVPSASLSVSDAATRKGELIRFEMALSARVLRYAHDAESGRINPNKISGYHDFPEKPFDMVAALKVLSLATRCAWLAGSAASQQQGI